MVNLTIDGKQISVKENTTIMEAAASNGIPIPHLCYLKEINEIAACRVCVVELEGKDRLITSCNNVVKEGMVIHTNSPKVRRHRRTNVELILSQHNCECVTCPRSGNCMLQTVANDLNILDIPYKMKIEKQPWNKEFPLIRDSSKCIKCMRCIQICDKVQSLNIWDVEGTGSRTTVNVSGHKTIEQSDCSLCGQCITHCPVGALRERDDTEKVWDALADPNKIVVTQVAPAVRAAWGEELGFKPGEATVGKILDALKRMGADYVFDTCFSADLTIMEEGTELVKRVTEGGVLPMFTSCCPAWVKFLEDNYPELKDHLSSAKSPQQIGGAIFKTYGAQLEGREGKDIYSVSVMPCTCKEFESERPEMKDSGFRDVDAAITTRDLAWLIKDMGIDWDALDEQEFDQPLGLYTGAGTIFGVTGGVMEAAIRTGYELVTGQPIPDLEVTAVRGTEGFRTSVIKVGDLDLKVGVVTGLKNVVPVLEAVKNGTLDLHFIEVMTCPEGCVSGGGQPKLLMDTDREEAYAARRAATFAHDRELTYRKSHENPAIKKIYEEFLEEPNSHIAHHLLHTTYCNK